MLSLDQRRVAYAIVSLLCLAWVALGLSGIITAYTTPIGMDGTGGFLFLLAIVGVAGVLVSLSMMVAGFVMIRRLNAGTWRWRTPFVLIGSTSAVSALVGALMIASSPTPGVLLVLQAVLLLGIGRCRASHPGRWSVMKALAAQPQHRNHADRGMSSPVSSRLS